MSLPVEHGITPVRGFREFGFDPAGCVLTGIVKRVPWPGPQVEAACVSPPICLCQSCRPLSAEATNGAHIIGCTCGLYAWHWPNLLDVERGSIVGVVEGYGTVVWAKRGWRASKARLLAVTVPADFRHELVQNEVSQRASVRYPGVALYDDWRAMFADWPAQVPAPNWSDSAVAMEYGQQLDQAWTGLAVGFQRMADAIHAAFDEIARQGIAGVDRRDESPTGRALRLRRTRNTGPAQPGMDGRPR